MGVILFILIAVVPAYFLNVMNRHQAAVADFTRTNVVERPHEVLAELKVYNATMQCSIVGCTGYMHCTSVLTSYPPIYKHRCSVCTNEAHYAEAYPGLRYVPK